MLCEGCGKIELVRLNSSRFCLDCCRKSCRKLYYLKNKKKIRSKQKEYYKANSSKLKNKAREYHRDNSEEIAKQKEKYYEANRDIFLEKSKRYAKENPKIHNARNAKRRADILNRTPAWADLEAIKEFYRNCPKGYHVDHIIPLRGKTVSGLHVLENLQYLPAKENLKKSNKFEG